MNDWPTEPVHMNHLEATGICMSLMHEELDRGGMSEPQHAALEKVHKTLGILLAQNERQS